MDSIYISGPMTGVGQYNFPAFEAAEEFWTHVGYVVFSPRVHDLEMGFSPDGPPPSPSDLRDMAEWDMQVLLSVDAIYMLTGWENSKGARAEHAIAVWLGLDIFYEG